MVYEINCFIIHDFFKIIVEFKPLNFKLTIGIVSRKSTSQLLMNSTVFRIQILIRRHNKLFSQFLQFRTPKIYSLWRKARFG